VTDTGGPTRQRPGADPYKILQVDSEADPDVIQAAYRRLAQKYHPDVTTGSDAAARMVAINAAWEVLRDPTTRAAFDRSRATVRRSDGGVGAAAMAGGVGPAGPPPGNPSGSVLVFGRYTGWSLGEIARRDLEYIEWLDRMPIGRPYREEIDAILRRAGRRTAPGQKEPPRGLFRRR
jgi:curved DNA-binding protein CbpA